MNNEELLKEILINQKDQTAILSDLLEQEKNNHDKYQEYLKEQEKANEDYRASLEKSSEDAAQKEEDRLAEHKAYMHGILITKIANYLRIVSSLSLVGMVGYILINGVKVI